MMINFSSLAMEVLACDCEGSEGGNWGRVGTLRMVFVCAANSDDELVECHREGLSLDGSPV